MSTSTAPTSGIALDHTLASRILREGYGPGAWHGPDLRAAIADVSASTAFRRPAPGRHNIAEIAMHHAFYVRSVIERLGGSPAAFPLSGEDWFELNDEGVLEWRKIGALLDSLQEQLATQTASSTRNGSNADEQLDLILGITCHAVYHAGQIQLIKALISARSS
jgi:hypothetical protein